MQTLNSNPTSLNPTLQEEETVKEKSSKEKMALFSPFWVLGLERYGLRVLGLGIRVVRAIRE